MAEREALALNESTPQILAPQTGDTYLLPRSFRCVGDGIFTANATSATSTRTSDAAAYTYLVRGGHGYAQAATNTTGAGLILAGGIGRRFFTITDYTAMAGSVFTLVINGTTSTKTEGVDFNAVTTNNQTATNLATAIDAIAGVSAVAVAAVVYVTPDDSTYSLTISENAAGATSTSGTNGTISAVGYVIKTTDTSDNAGYGRSAFNANPTGTKNTGIGAAALYGLTTGEANTAVGESALFAVTTASSNTGVGSGALANMQGATNTAVGLDAGRNATSGGNETSGTSVYIGANTKAFADGDANEIVIGNAAIGAGSNTATLGNTSIVQTVLRGKVYTGDEVFLPYTNTAVGTTGNQTINKASGRVNIAAAGTTVTVTNSLVTANSQVFAIAVTNDATARVTNVVPAAGSFVINTVAVTAETAFAFLVIGAD